MKTLLKVVVEITIGIILIGVILMPVIERVNISGEDTLDVIILGGQSNIAYNPLRVDAEVVNEQIGLPSTNCYYFGTESQAVQYDRMPISDCSMLPMVVNEQWHIGGEEPAIAKVISDYTNDDVYIINVAIGGFSISQFAPGSIGGNWINSVLDAALDFIPDRYTVNKVGWVWCQGESDKTTPVSSYVESFGSLDDYFKTKGFDYCYLVETRPIDSGNATAAQRELPGIYDNVEMACTAPATFSVANGMLRDGDALHYSQAGRNVVGEDVGEAIASNLSTHSRNGIESEILAIIPVFVAIGLIIYIVPNISSRFGNQ